MMWFHWVWLHGSRRSRPPPPPPPLNPPRHRRPWIRHTPASPTPPFFFPLHFFVLALRRSAPSRQSAHSTPPPLVVLPSLFSPSLPRPASECRRPDGKTRARPQTHTRTRPAAAWSRPLPALLRGNSASASSGSSGLICALRHSNTRTEPPARAPPSFSCTLPVWWEPNGDGDRVVQLRGKQQQEKQSAGRRLEGWSLSRK